MKKWLKWVGVVCASVILVACGQTTTKTETTTKAPEQVKVAVVGSASREIWEFVAEKAKKENIAIEVVEMNDYVQPNKALTEGSVQMNAFQHRNYLARWNKEHGTDIQELGVTFITPLYYFSTKYKSLQELPQKAKVIIPKEVAIQGRALVALQTAGLIKLKDGGHTNSAVADVIENHKNIEFIEVDSAQAPQMLADVDAATVNGSMAVDAGMKIEDNIFTDADHINTIPSDRFNIIAVNGKDKMNETYQKIVKLYQSDDVVKKMNEISPGQYFPVWNK